MTDRILWTILIACIVITWLVWRSAKAVERFIDNDAVLTSVSTAALDAAPTPTEAGMHYKKLLLFIDDDNKKSGSCGLALIADFGRRLYNREIAIANFTDATALANWPPWLDALSTTVKEPVPDADTAADAERSLLAYIAKYFPEEPTNEEKKFTAEKLIADFGRRFIFNAGEKVELRPDLVTITLVNNWANPCAVR